MSHYNDQERGKTFGNKWTSCTQLRLDYEINTLIV